MQLESTYTVYTNTNVQLTVQPVFFECYKFHEFCGFSAGRELECLAIGKNK